MYNTLSGYLKRPELYERTSEKFWNDLHIATQMLEAHLDPSTDAASRKPDFIDRSVSWIAALLPKGSKLLDIGCGPGLYAKRFSERGLRVTGLDFSENSIAYARKRDHDGEYMVQDYLSMDFDGLFDMITLIYYDYGALVPNERRNLLGRVYKALKPGGLFLFDVYSQKKSHAKQESASWEVHPSGGFWSKEPHICLKAEHFYGETALGTRYVVIEENDVRCYNLWDCLFTKESILAETAGHGFAEHGFFADVAGQPFSEDSEAICAVLIKP